MKPNILEFMKDGVVFEDGTTVEKVDTVIFATGYSFAFPMIEDGTLVEVNENQVLLYKYMFPIGLAPKVCSFWFVVVLLKYIAFLEKIELFCFVQGGGGLTLFPLKFFF